MTSTSSYIGIITLRVVLSLAVGLIVGISAGVMYSKPYYYLIKDGAATMLEKSDVGRYSDYNVQEALGFHTEYAFVSGGLAAAVVSILFLMFLMRKEPVLA